MIVSPLGAGGMGAVDTGFPCWPFFLRDGSLKRVAGVRGFDDGLAVRTLVFGRERTKLTHLPPTKPSGAFIFAGAGLALLEGNPTSATGTSSA